MMTLRLILVACAMSPSVWAVGSPLQSRDPDVALAPFAVAGAGANDLRPVADECLDRLAATLTEKGVRIGKLPSLDEKTLARAKPARWAVLGRFERVKDRIQAELRLMEVASGDEMVSYSNSGTDPKEMAALGARAAERIARFVAEKKRGGA
jgi:hypothetical protein